MALIQALLAAVSRSFGKILNTAFGWATTMLFGRVPQDRQIHLSIITFASVIWLVLLIGVIWPSAATFLLAFVTLPDWIDDNLIRMVMLAGAVLLPLINGGIAIFMLPKERRPGTTKDRAKLVFQGYPYTLGLALTLVMMIVFAPIMKLQDLIRRWQSTHVPIIVHADDYASVVRDIERVLEKNGRRAQAGKASWMMRAPTRIFTALAGSVDDNLVAKNLTVLRGNGFEVLIHPSDLVIRGKQQEVVRIHAILSEQLTFTEAYMTWTKEGNELEDRLSRLWHRTQRGNESSSALLHGLNEIEESLRRVEVPYEEWEVLFREKLTVERAVLRGHTGARAAAEDQTGVGVPAAGTTLRMLAKPAMALLLATAQEELRRGKRRSEQAKRAKTQPRGRGFGGSAKALLGVAVLGILKKVAAEPAPSPRDRLEPRP